MRCDPLILQNGCSCGRARLAAIAAGAGLAQALFLCLFCDAPETPCGPDTATWEINLRARGLLGDR